MLSGDYVLLSDSMATCTPLIEPIVLIRSGGKTFLCAVKFLVPKRFKDIGCKSSKDFPVTLSYPKSYNNMLATLANLDDVLQQTYIVQLGRHKDGYSGTKEAGLCIQK